MLMEMYVYMSKYLTMSKMYSTKYKSTTAMLLFSHSEDKISKLWVKDFYYHNDHLKKIK